MTCCNATSPRPVRTSGGWPTSPTLPPGPGSSTSHSSWTCSPGRSWLVRRHQQTGQARPQRPRHGPVAPRPCRNSRWPGPASPFGCRQPVHVFRLHRASPRRRHQCLDRHRRRRPGQRADGIPDRPLQDRVDQPRKPWRGLADVELATAEWVDWFNNQRLHTAIGDIPPTSTRPTTTLNTSPNRWLESTHRASTDPGAVHRRSVRATGPCSVCPSGQRLGVRPLDPPYHGRLHPGRVGAAGSSTRAGGSSDLPDRSVGAAVRGRAPSVRARAAQPSGTVRSTRMAGEPPGSLDHGPLLGSTGRRGRGAQSTQAETSRTGVAPPREEPEGAFVSSTPSDRSQEPLMNVRAAVILIAGRAGCRGRRRADRACRQLLGPRGAGGWRFLLGRRRLHPVRHQLKSWGGHSPPAVPAQCYRDAEKTLPRHRPTRRILHTVRSKPST